MMSAQEQFERVLALLVGLLSMATASGCLYVGFELFGANGELAYPLCLLMVGLVYAVFGLWILWMCVSVGSRSGY